MVFSKSKFHSATGAGSGEVNTGANVGSGEGVFKNKTGTTLNFKTLLATGSISLISDTNTITISSSAGDGGENNTASNLGSGEGVFANKTGIDLQFRTLLATGSISLISGSNTITISGSDTGEVNTASNLGSGEGVFANKVGADLQFRSIVGSGSILVTSGSNEITISLSGSSFQKQVEKFNAAAAQTAFVLIDTPADPTDVLVYVNGVLYNYGEEYTVSGNTVTWLDTPFVLSLGEEVTIEYEFEAPGGFTVGENNTASNVGSGEGVFDQKVGVDLRFRSISGAGSVSVISGSNEIIISGSGGSVPVTSYRTSFVSASLSSSVILDVTHSLGEKYVGAFVYDGADFQIIPDEVIVDTANTLRIDLSSFVPISGTWNVFIKS